MSLNAWGGLNTWGGVVNYSLSVDAGNYAYNGRNASLVLSIPDYVMIAESGSYTYGGLTVKLTGPLWTTRTPVITIWTDK